MSEQTIAERLRETWPKCNLHGQITAARRSLVHSAADEIERLERQRDELLTALKKMADPRSEFDDGTVNFASDAIAAYEAK